MTSVKSAALFLVLGLVLGLALASAAFGQTPAPPAPPAPVSPAAPMSPVAPRAAPLAPRGVDVRPRVRVRGMDASYDRGTHALDRGEWEEARTIFAAVAQAKGTRADGALYWQAYAANRLGRRDEALAALGTLRQQYPSSDWLNDAQALTVEVQQQAGKPVDPNASNDEELKLMAINALLHTDAERAVPLLEKILKSASSPRLKDNALFVLSQSRSPQAQQLLLSIAKGGSNPDLQLRALNNIAIGGSKDAAANILSIYKSSHNAAVKKQALNSLMLAQASNELYEVARSEQDADLRNDAIRGLAMLHQRDKLAELYQAGISRDAILDSMFLSGDPAKLLDILKTEKDPKLRLKAIHSLGLMHSAQAGDGLVALYSTETDSAVRKQVVESLFIQQNAKGLVAIARKESNPEMKKEIVRRLSMMNSKDSSEYLMELLK